jgi:hypothetical protein
MAELHAGLIWANILENLFTLNFNPLVNIYYIHFNLV